jgi:MFS family permease
MKVIRRILGVILGYLIFVVSAVLLFQLARRNPHAEQPMVFMVGSIAYGIIFAAIGGYVSAVLGRGSPRVQGGAVAIIIALGATVSMLAGPNAGSMWSRVGALFLMAPSAAVGGIFRARQVTRQGRVE